MSEITASQKQKGQKVALIVVLMIVGFFCLNTTIWMVAVTLTSGDKSHGVVPEYSEAANSAADFEVLIKKSDRLKWSVVSQTQFPLNLEKKATWRMQLRDDQDIGIPDAKITVKAFHNSAIKTVQNAQLICQAEGWYETSLRFRKSGRWRFWIHAKKDDKDFYVDHVEYIRVPKGVK